MKAEHDLLLELSIPADWQRIDQVREAVASSLGAVFGVGSGGVDEMLSMVSTELLENALKYGAPGHSVRFRLESADNAVVVHVSNQLPSDSQHGRTLRERISWLQSFEDPPAAYAAALQRVFAGVGSGSDGGLGIARILHEGQCQLDCDVSNADMITVTARWTGAVSG